jgi:hypothetical protein
MKTKSTSHSAFFSCRVLIGLPVLAGVFALPLLLGNPAAAGGRSAAQSATGRIRGGESKQKSPQSQTGTPEKMIVTRGSVAMDVDLNRLNGISSTTQKLDTLHFGVKPDSFFTVVAFNNVLRGAEFGSAIALVPQSSATLPPALNASLNQLVAEKLPSGNAFDLAVRDGKTGFVFFNIEGNLYDYDANAQLLTITGKTPHVKRVCQRSWAAVRRRSPVLEGIDLNARELAHA